MAGLRLPDRASHRANGSINFLRNQSMSEIPATLRLVLLSLSVGALSAGSVFADSLQVLHSFSGADGAAPTELIQTPDGTFYGVTTQGGDTTACSPDGCGTVFKSDIAGNVTTLHVFHATDGYSPSGLFAESHGKLYGTTRGGG